MKKGRLLLANYDARISNINIKPKNKSTKVIFTSKVYDTLSEKKKTVKVGFLDVAPIDFRINYFDNMIGAEAFGLYQIEDKSFIERLVREIFERRKEIYLLEGNYDYEEDEPNDMLNVMDLDGSFMQGINNYNAYVQNVDAGVYIVVAKDMQMLG